MRWTRRTIIEEIRKLKHEGAALNYAAAEDRYLNLVRAAAWHFGTWRRAVESAGINYEKLSKYRRWDRERIVARIRELDAEGKDLSWRAISLETDPPLAAAALRPNGFASWRDAVSAAGLDINEVARYQCWDKPRVLRDIKALHRAGQPLASKDMQEANQPLFCAARRRFGSWDDALAAAGLDVTKIRRRRPCPALHLPRRKRGEQPSLFSEAEVAALNGASAPRRGRKPSPELQEERQRAARAAQLSVAAAAAKPAARTNGSKPATPARAAAARAASAKAASAKAASAKARIAKSATSEVATAKAPDIRATAAARAASAKAAPARKAASAKPAAPKAVATRAKKTLAPAGKAAATRTAGAPKRGAKGAPAKSATVRSASAAARKTPARTAARQGATRPAAKKSAPAARVAPARRGRAQ